MLAEEARTSKLQEQVRKQKAALKTGRKERQQLMDTCDQLIYANRRLQSDEKQASRKMRETLQDYREVQKKRQRKRTLAATRVAGFKQTISTLRHKFERHVNRRRLHPVGEPASAYEREIALAKDGYNTTLTLIHSLQQSADELMSVFDETSVLDYSGLGDLGEDEAATNGTIALRHDTTALGELSRRLEEENETLRRNLSEERTRLRRFHDRHSVKVQQLRADLSIEKASGKRLAERLADAHKLKSHYQEQLILNTTAPALPATPIRTTRSPRRTGWPRHPTTLSTDLLRLDSEIHSLEDSIMSMSRSMTDSY